jgi:hypothetical protein
MLSSAAVCAAVAKTRCSGIITGQRATCNNPKPVIEGENEWP